MKLNLKVLPKFPADVIGSGFLTVLKQAAKFTFGIDYSLIAPVSVIDPASKAFVVQDTTDGSFGLITLADTVAAGLFPRTITADGDVNVSATDTYIRLNKTTPAVSNVNLPAAASRNGLPLTIKDVAGNADTYNYTIIPNGAETIDGLTTYSGVMKYQVISLVPRAGGYDVTHSG